MSRKSFSDFGAIVFDIKQEDYTVISSFDLGMLDQG